MKKKRDHFPNLNFVWQSTKTKSALMQLQTEFENRFADFIKFSSKMDIFENPFVVDIDNVPSDLQINVIDLRVIPHLKWILKKQLTWWISKGVCLLKTTRS